MSSRGNDLVREARKRARLTANRPQDQRVLPVPREILATRHDRPGA